MLPGTAELAERVGEHVEARDFGAALSALQQFVEKVIFNPASVAKVFTSLDLDQLCKAVALEKSQSLVFRRPADCRGTVILVSELSKAGGHNELIKDIARLKLFPEPLSIVQTDCFDRVDDAVSKSFGEIASIDVQTLDGAGIDEKFEALVASLHRAPPEKLLLLAHNQDALAVAAAFAAKAASSHTEVVYVHHGDHHLSLGAATQDFVHVDPHNIGYYHCRNELDNRCNHYWPLTVGVRADHHRKTPFLSAGSLVTCSTGRAEKFEAGSYLYDYFELLPDILRTTGGRHVHIGHLHPAQLERLDVAMAAAGIDRSRIVHIPWVASVAEALVAHEVDLYVSSFPLGGGKATLEAMATGTPLLMHESYRSRFFGGVDIAYPGAFVWRNVAELLDVFGRIDAGVLAEHSSHARFHFEKFHRDELLVSSCDFDHPQDESIIPALTAYRSDPLECFLDDERRRDAESRESRREIERQFAELQAYEKQAQHLHGELTQMTAKAVSLEGTLQTTRHDLETKIGRYLRKIEADQKEIDKAQSLLQEHASRGIQISQLQSEVQALRTSTSWRVTKPLRFVSRLMKTGRVQVDPPVRGAPSESADARRGPDAAYRTAAVALHRGLPIDFDGQVYLKLNPDLMAAGVDPAAHFLSYGQREGRHYALPEFTVTRSASFDAAMPTVLLVSHEASRTGAPILSLNLVQVLAHKYNVVALLLGGGALKQAFEETGATVLMAATARGNPFVAHYVANQICDAFDLQFALVNSIESRAVLPVLAERFVPTISLVHEFASYTRPRDAFRQALLWSSEVVFSANVTRENAFSTFPELAEASAIVLPQGKCVLPASTEDAASEQHEAQRLQEMIRPKGLDADVLIVLGAGFVQLRKGVDLFIECAARVKRQAGGRRVRFVWIGNGYDPESDIAYSAYLQDQVRRADLAGDVVFLGETSAIEAAYEKADLFLLSSRLDPLPNVAIDAMSQGLPVLCFDKTTGIADFLHEVGLGPHCVAGYLDTDDIARKILDFAASRATIAEVGAACRRRAGEYFNMTHYVERIESLADDVQARVRDEEADYRTIAESGVLRTDFADMPPEMSVDQLVRQYVRTWASGIGRRKPFPGFHPGIYLEQHGVQAPGSDPLADYLRNGRPQGAWNYPVITPDVDGLSATAAECRIALHIHAHYADLLPDILGRLASNRQRPDLFISVTSDEARLAAEAHVRAYDGRTIRITVVPNRGRDIGPFFTEFFESIKDAYDLVGHVHTKKSVDVKDGNVGKRWFQFLMSNLLGNESARMMDIIVERMQGDPSIGLVFPDDPHISGMEANRGFAESIGEKIGIHRIPEYFLYPMGTMFWARTAALQVLGDLKLTWDDYPSEPLPYDGSMLHALERLIALALPLGPWTLATTNVKGVTR